MDRKIGIICAGDTELEPFLEHIQDHTMAHHAMLTFHMGYIHDVPVIVLYSGVCKVNAAIATQILMDTYHADTIINAGTAGGMDESVQLFDTIVTAKAAYHDVADDILTEFHPWLPSIYFHSDPELISLMERIVAKTDYPIHFGTTVTGEQFIADEKRAEINGKYSPLSVDMETASVAHVCHVNQVPFIAIRTITDTAAHSGMENFDKNCLQASMIAKEITLLLLEEMKN